MGIGFVWFLVLMATSPRPSLQKLGDCKYEPNDIYILFEASTFSTQFLGGIAKYLEEIQGVVKDAVASSDASRVSLTAFTSEGPTEYVAISSGLTSSQVDKKVQTVSSTQLGGTMADALSYIASKKVGWSSNGNPVTLVVIFTSALTNKNLVKSYLDTLSFNQRIKVKVFPVGILAFNSASKLPYVTNIISNLVSFGQEVTNNLFPCAEGPGGTGNPDGLCTNWQAGESGLHPYAGRCDKFYQCSHMKAYAMQCPFGQLYDKTKMVCDHPHSVLQSVTSGCEYCHSTSTAVHPYSDSCELYYQCGTDDNGPTLFPKCCPPNQGFVEGVGCQADSPCMPRNYTHHGSCRNYFQCVDGAVAVKCCPDGQAFDMYAGFCRPEVNGCSKPCIGEKPVCDLKPDDRSICRYLITAHGVDIPRPCPDKHAWDQVLCRCSEKVPGAENCGIQPEECEPDFISGLDAGGEWGFPDDSGTWKYIQNNGVGFPGEHAVFHNGAYLTVYHFANVDWPKPVWARLIFQCSPQTSGNEVLLSNGCYNDGPGHATVYMEVDPSAKTLTAGIKTNQTTTSASVNWSFDTTPDTWLQATMRYDGRYLEVNMKDNSVSTSTVSASVPATGRILISKCALQIGRGNGGEKIFEGNIDEVSVYSMCNYPPSVES